MVGQYIRWASIWVGYYPMSTKWVIRKVVSPIHKDIRKKHPILHVWDLTFEYTRWPLEFFFKIAVHSSTFSSTFSKLAVHPTSWIAVHSSTFFISECILLYSIQTCLYTSKYEFKHSILNKYFLLTKLLPYTFFRQSQNDICKGTTLHFFQTISEWNL